MAFSFTTKKRSIIGDLVIVAGTWNAAGVTSGNITHSVRDIVYAEFFNKTAQRGVLDDTTTAKTLALTGVTSNDIGRWLVIGYE
jgi:hypothetical protein